ncbi:hypothetical protein HanIR_Chr16g0792331 [Helianthus annuus]|nr:hypothetical protein HanIR_Chr16g0792331 [Helianthus annuus]
MHLNLFCLGLLLGSFISFRPGHVLFSLLDSGSDPMSWFFSGVSKNSYTLFEVKKMYPYILTIKRHLRK